MAPKRNGLAPVPDEVQVAPAELDMTGETDYGLGDYLVPFQQPHSVGQITALEATELRARAATIKRLDDDANHLRLLRNIAEVERRSYAWQIGARYGLTQRDEMTINDESGEVIHSGHRVYVVPQPEPTPIEEPAAVEPATESVQRN